MSDLSRWPFYPDDCARCGHRHNISISHDRRHGCPHCDCAGWVMAEAKREWLRAKGYDA